MKVPLSWLQELVDVADLSLPELLDVLSLNGLEVEQVLHPGAGTAGVRVKRVVAWGPHPDADKLRVVQVTDGEVQTELVCGASNFDVGDVVAHAEVGATIPGEDGPFQLEARKLRGADRLPLQRAFGPGGHWVTTGYIGPGYTIERSFRRLDGSTIDPASGLRQNDRLVVVLKVTEAKAEAARLLLVDPLPAGLEIDNPKLLDADALQGLAFAKSDVQPVHTEFRDDRFVAAYDRDPSQSAFFTVAYTVRAVSPGTYVHPGATVEDMYRPARFGRTASGSVTVGTAK